MSGAVIALLATALGGALPPAQFARPQHMVDIGGRRLNLFCSGSGPVTVVFDAPSGEAGWNWYKVHPAVAQRTRACVYDRAGLGFSEASPRPGTSGNAVDDLHKLLGAAAIAPPYVMVGSSYGAANVQLYAYRYPSEVKGLVLVDGQHEDEIERANKVTEGKLGQMMAMNLGYEKACMAQAENGFIPGSELARNCVGGVMTELGRELGAARLVERLSLTAWRARVSEESHYAIGDAELRAARRSYGAMPLQVLVRGVSPFAVPGRPPSALNKALEAENLAIQKKMAALSTQGRWRIVAGAGHVIHDSHPEAVIEAINTVLGQVQP